ncbi:C-C motif chemokine 22, partial [Leptonychotes weddellii]|uniref:C-C motif chemokine n=1 Tax=Leptonychotes weddellii TaxID=9713 RepID=A0A7F8Q2Q3_LEPWE
SAKHREARDQSLSNETRQHPGKNSSDAKKGKEGQVWSAGIERKGIPGPFGANVEDSICCQDYFRHPLPLRMLKFFYWTSDSCRRPGVVFLTVKDREICADPRMPWVKKILQKLDS